MTNMWAAVKLTVVLLCAILVVKAQSDQTCKTENSEEGVCINLQKCYSLKRTNKTATTSAQQLEIIARERSKCTNDSPDEDLVCCKRKPPIKLSWSFEDSKLPPRFTSDVLPDASVCGRSHADKIFHGNVTKLGQYPWLALIKYIRNGEETFDCGSSLINNRYVLTAAHCITSNIYEVRIGEWNLDMDPDCEKDGDEIECSPPVIDVAIDSIKLHKNYTRRDSQGGKVDLALIRLNQDITFNEYVSPVCLPTTEDQAIIKGPLIVSGWGFTEQYVPSAKKLFTVLEHLEQEQCVKELNSPFIKVDDTVICARGRNGQDSCAGDSGGPLMQISSAQIGNFKVNREFLVGVVSSGLACGTSKPAFYSNVYKQLNWIVSNME